MLKNIFLRLIKSQLTLENVAEFLKTILDDRGDAVVDAVVKYIQEGRDDPEKAEACALAAAEAVEG